MEFDSLYDPFAVHFDTFVGDVYTLDTASIVLTGGSLTAKALTIEPDIATNTVWTTGAAGPILTRVIDAAGPALILRKANEGPTWSGSGGFIGTIHAQGYHVTDTGYKTLGRIRWKAAALHAHNDMPTELFLGVALGGTESVAEVWKYDLNGNHVPVTNNTYDIGTDSLKVRHYKGAGTIESGDDITSGGDVITGTGNFYSALGDLWLGNAVQGSAPFQAYANGNVFAASVTAEEYLGGSDIHLREGKITLGANDEAFIEVFGTSPINTVLIIKTDETHARKLIIDSETIFLDATKNAGTPTLFTFADDNQLKFKESGRPWVSANYDDREIHFCTDIPYEGACPVFFDDGSLSYVLKIEGFTNTITVNGTLNFRDSAIGIYSQANTFLDLFADGSVRIGDSSAGAPTNYMEIESDGDVNFVAGAGLQFGEIYYHDSGFNVVLAAQDTDYQVVGFNTDGESNGDVTPDQTNDHITVVKAGRYSISYSASIRSAQANIYDFKVKYNNGTTGIVNSCTHRNTTVAGKLGVIATTFFANLPASATVEMWVSRADGGAVAKTVTLEQVNLNVIQIGGTT